MGFSNGVEAFPELGGSSASRKPAPKAAASEKTTAHKSFVASLSAAPKKAAAPAKVAPSVVAVAPKKAAAPASGESFPSLGGSAPKGTSSSWAAGAQARAAAKAEPAKPAPVERKEFNATAAAAESFPGLPTAAPKKKSTPAPRSTAERARAQAKTDAEAKAASAAAKALDESLADAWEDSSPAESPEIVADDQLVMIHDPLEAVAQTEAAEAIRRANKVKKGGKKGAVFINPWSRR